jgi:hypothetical protein
VLYPNYVYRPQRVKGKKSAANGKGKARGAEDPETDTEGLSFVMPVPAVPQRIGRRALSVPTPPPAYQQTIHIPMVYMPSTPDTPPMVPIAHVRTCSPTQYTTQGMGYDYVPPNGALLPAFNNPPQGWTPDGCEDAYANVFDIPQLDPLSIPPCAPPPDVLFKSPSPGSYTNSNSSGPSSPHTSPYTPTALETLHVTADAWQAQASLPMLDVEPPMPVSLEYQPYTWATAPDLWVSGSAPMFNEDFDIAMIPPISIEVPKFDGFAHVADQSCAQDFLHPQTGEQDGDAYAPVFTFNDANEIQLVDGF